MAPASDREAFDDLPLERSSSESQSPPSPSDVASVSMLRIHHMNVFGFRYWEMSPVSRASSGGGLHGATCTQAQTMSRSLTRSCAKSVRSHSLTLASKTRSAS